jgi:hypothetical protein
MRFCRIGIAVYLCLAFALGGYVVGRSTYFRTVGLHVRRGNVVAIERRDMRRCIYQMTKQARTPSPDWLASEARDTSRERPRMRIYTVYNNE